MHLNGTGFASEKREPALRKMRAIVKKRLSIHQWGVRAMMVWSIRLNKFPEFYEFNASLRECDLHTSIT